jgi:acyl-CoA thioester hydrolase
MMVEPISHAMEGGVHRYPVRVYYEDTDAGGVVYHANYLQFAERARTEFLRGLGMQQSRIAEEHGTLFVIRRCVADFLAPARLDDLLVVTSRVLDVRGASLDLQQIVTRDDLDLVRLHVKLACMTSCGRPKRLPCAVRSAFAQFSGNFWLEDGKQRG